MSEEDDGWDLPEENPRFYPRIRIRRYLDDYRSESELDHDARCAEAERNFCREPDDL